MSEINFCNTKEQLNHLGEVVTGKVDGSPSGADIDTSTLPYTEQVRKTLPALEGEYEQSIANKESEADAVIDEYRLSNKGPYTSGIALESKFEYITYNGESYFATNPPYTTTATTPDADGNLFAGGYTTIETVANKIGNLNLLSNSNFLTPSPDAITHPNAIPESYVAGTQIFSGVYAGSSGATVTLIDGRVNCSAGSYEYRVANTNGLDRVPVFTSSVSEYDGNPVTTGVSHVLVGDEYVVTVTPAAGDVFSVKFEQGDITTRHEVKSLFDIYGHPNMGIYNPKAFGAKGDGSTEDTAIIEGILEIYRALDLTEGVYSVNLTIGNHFKINGESSDLVTLKAHDSSKPVVKNMYVEPTWNYPTIKGVTIEGKTNAYEGVGFSFGDINSYSAGDENIGRVKMTDVYFNYLDKSIQKCYGNIGNIFENVSSRFTNYFYWARGSQAADPSYGISHAGADLFIGGQVSNTDKMCFLVLDNTGGLGQWTFINTIVQFNAGGTFFWDVEGTSLAAWQAVAFHNIWNEGNATASSVTIDALGGGTRTITPSDKFQQTNFGPDYYELGKIFKHGTTSELGRVNVWGNERVALNLEGGGYGTGDYVDLAFSNKAYPNIAGAHIRSTLAVGEQYLRDIEFNVGGVNLFKLNANKSFSIGDPYLFTPPSDRHIIYGDTSVAPGSTFLEMTGTQGNASINFNTVNGTNSTMTGAAIDVPSQAVTGRSINAAGTVNASGADYAEYFMKSVKCETIEKGDVCGLDANGELTTIFDDAVSFCVKSTNPSIVGNDNWFDLTPPELKSVDELDSHEDYELHKAGYQEELKAYNAAHEEARLRVDRIALCGQVPVNVAAKVGDYIIPKSIDGKISGAAIAEPSFNQYTMAIGRVVKVKDGNVTVIVKPV